MAKESTYGTVTPLLTDYVRVVDDPGGTPATANANFAAIRTLLQANVTNLTVTNATANSASISSTGYSLTGADATSMVDLAGTWNTTGTPTAIKLNLTDTASNAASLLMDLQVGGTSQLKIGKAGALTIAGTVEGVVLDAYYGLLTLKDVNGTDQARLGPDDVAVSSIAPIGWASGRATAIGSGSDTSLYRDSAQVIGMRSSSSPTSPNTFRVYNTYTDASNYETAGLAWSGNVFNIQTSAAGTGTARSINFAPATGTVSFTGQGNASVITSTGYSLTGADITPLLDLAGTWNTTGAARGIKLNIANTASASASRLLALEVNSSEVFYVTVSGQIVSTRGISTSIFESDTNYTYMQNVNFVANAASYNTDTTLRRGGTGILEQRSGSTAQTFRVFNTYTDASNGEWGFMRWASNVLEIGSAANGTGSNRVVKLLSASGAYIQLGSTPQMATSGQQVVFDGANFYNEQQTSSLGRSTKGWTGLYLIDSASDLTAPTSAGKSVFWHSDGTGTGSDGDYVFYIRSAADATNIHILPHQGAQTDYILVSDGTTGGASSAGAGNQYVEITVNGTTYKVLHDGTV